ncbi:MAG TPA: hypothetical protein VFS00_23440 [Polyangiaceae bacterium]|nr:hypothetical protein [Polyangiaceae bacterium]
MTTLADFQTSSTGMPQMGDDSSSRALGLTMSLAPTMTVTSVLAKSSLISSISWTMS